MNTGQTATLGRIVHFTCDTNVSQKLNQLGGKRYNVGDKVPGIVTSAGENNVCNLKLMPDADDTLQIPHVPFSTGGQPGTWAWPERTGTGETGTAAEVA